MGEDATSLIFLHAAARPATNKESFRLIYDRKTRRTCWGGTKWSMKTGSSRTIPIRYGVNIAEWNWEKRDSSHDYAYGADAVPVGGAEGIPSLSSRSSG